MAAERSFHPLIELTRVRILEFIREPEAVFWVFVFPVLLALALGIAFRNNPVTSIPVAVIVDSGTLEDLVDQLERTEGLNVSVLPAAEAADALRRARVDVIVDLTAADVENSGAVTFRFDAARTEGRAAKLAVDDALQRALGRTDVIVTSEDRVTEPGSRYIDFLIPGLVGLNLMGSGMWGLGFSIVVARTQKLLKRFAATPMRRPHYLMSFAISRMLFLGLEVAAVVGFGWLIFGVKVHGALLDLALVALLGASCFNGIGLLVAARPRTVEAVSGWMNLVMLPMWLLSGTFFSYERFPEVLLPAIRLLPLTALNDALRAVINDGANLWAVWSPLVILVVWGTVSFFLALRLFRWQ